MSRNMLVLALAALVALPTVYAQQPGSTPLDSALSALSSIDWGQDRDKLLAIDQAIVAGVDLEDRLLPILASETASDAAKSFVCRKLKEVGTSESVSILAPLLDDSELSHMARYALESIPGAESSKALIDAIPRLQGEPLIGVITSLGRRGDLNATEALVTLLSDDGEAITCASLIALAGIETETAQQAVIGYAKQASGREREVALDASLSISQRLISKGKLKEATVVMDALQTIGDPKLEVAILRGRLLCEPDKATARLLDAFQSDDDELSNFAAEFARQSATKQQVDILAEAIPRMSLQRQILLLDALSNRESSVVRRTAIASLSSDDRRLKLTAVRALRVSGSVEYIRLLVSLASREDDALFDEVVAVLSSLGGPEIESILIEMLPNSEPDGQIAAIAALQNRGSRDARASLLDLARNGVKPVRLAALRALEALPDETTIEPLIEMLTETPAGTVRGTVERTLWITCLKTLDPASRSEPLLQALAGSDLSQRIALLPCLGRMGGDKALRLVLDAMKQDDAELRNAALRALTNWPDDSVAEEMWKLAKTAEQKEHRIWALRGFARVIARQGRSDPEGTCERLKEALAIAKRVEDKQLILSRLTAARTPASLDV
ncbi:MAG: HEAT repeat domain-containing protein, partial [Lacipirellulaceae bacterium]